MKKLQIFGLLGLVMVLAFAMTACNNDDDDDSSSPPAVTMDSLVGYGMLNGQVVQVVISETARVVLTPATGQYYVIKFLSSGEIISIGKIEYAAPLITFIPDSGGDSFTGTYSLGGYLFIGVPYSGSVTNVLFDYNPSVGTPTPGANTTAVKTITITGLKATSPELATNDWIRIYSDPDMTSGNLIAEYQLASTDFSGKTNVYVEKLKDTTTTFDWTGGEGYIRLVAGTVLYYTGGKDYVKGSDLKKFIFTGKDATFDIGQFKKAPVKAEDFILSGNISYEINQPFNENSAGALQWTRTHPTGTLPNPTDMFFYITPPPNSIGPLDAPNGKLTYNWIISSADDPDDVDYAPGTPNAIKITGNNIVDTDITGSYFGGGNPGGAIATNKVFYIYAEGTLVFPNTTAGVTSNLIISRNSIKVTVID